MSDLAYRAARRALEADPNVVVSTAPQLSYDYMGINLTREPFNDVRVRQAIALALDRDVAGKLGRRQRGQRPRQRSARRRDWVVRRSRASAEGLAQEGTGTS